MSAYAAERVTPRARYAQNIYFRDGTVVTAVLVALLYLLLAVSLDAAGYVDNLTVLVPVTLGAFALGLLMSVSRYDGFFALSHSMFTGLAWILFLMSGSVTRVEIAPFLSNGIPEPQAQAYFVLLRWLNWVDAAINNVASADNYVFIFEMAFLVWWLTYLGVWSIFRYGYIWRAVIPAGIVLLINAYYAPESILGFLFIFLLLALLLLVRTNLSEQQLRWREQRVQFSQDIALDFLRNGLLYSVIVLALAWILPGLGRNVQVRTVLAPINQQWEQTTERVNRLYQGLNRQASPAAATFGNTLTLSGERNIGNELVFRVRTPIGRYWRAVVYDTFTGQTWLSTAGDEMAFDAEETVPLADWEMRRPITQTFSLHAPAGYVLMSAPDMLRVSVPMAATIRPIPADRGPSTDGASGNIEISTARSRQPIERGDSYTVVSLNTTVTEMALRAASTDYPQEILDQYLQLPDNFSERVAADALDITAEEDTVYGKARALELHLRSYEYNDAIEAPPEGRDPVEYFLYDIREGYCDYYATSMALMLRSLDIPSRVVSGYAEGLFDEETGEYFVTQRDAHTWVEVYFPEYGWIEFEPTAGESQLNRPRGSADVSNPFEDSAGPAGSGDFFGEQGMDEMFDPSMDPNAYGEDFELGADTFTLTERTWWIWGLLAPLLLAVGLVYIWRTRFVGPTEFDPNLSPILYDRLQGWAVRLGLRPLPSRTPYENARQLGHAVPEGRVPIDSITESYVQFRFSGKQRHGSAVHAHGAWKELRPVLWRAWLNKLFRRRPSKNGDPFALIEE
jgi:transglutaminase-like putative cysteine protease